MYISKITWWLGNQMFQYAYIKSLSLRQKKEFKLDISWFKHYTLHKYCLEFFDIQKTYATTHDTPWYEHIYIRNKYGAYIWERFIKPFLIVCNPWHHQEKQFHFDPSFLDISSWYIDGYFQTEKYFLAYEDEIRKDFTFIISPDVKNQEMAQKIKNANSVSLHIRRWDYVTNATTSRIHGTCDLVYYQEAIRYILQHVENPIFFLFSDDIDRVKKHLKLDSEKHYIDFNNAEKNYEDLRLMSLCKHNIIANSSFSWRWAWLNNNSNKIVIAHENGLMIQAEIIKILYQILE